MHPRDMDTWILQDIQAEIERKQDEGMAAARQEYQQRMGG